MKITIYTTTDCQFSKQEKDYLTGHALQYEEKNLETNRDFLTEMLTVSNNFAGTPVTRIEKDDGQIVVLKGFTVEEFDQALGFAKPAVATQAGDQPGTQPTPTTPPTGPVDQPTTPPMPSVPEPMTPPPATPPEGDKPVTSDPRMADLLSSLQQKANDLTPQTPVTTPQVPTQPEPVSPPAPQTPTVPQTPPQPTQNPATPPMPQIPDPTF